MGIFRKLVDSEYKELKRFERIADQIIEKESEMAALSDEELKNKTNEFKERLANGESLNDLVVDAFAVVREVDSRILGEKPYYVQILGGLAIHYGNIAEMKTGEGKTLTETMPAYLNALEGKGVHIITVNEFLAKRDSEWMGNIFRFLGLTVGLNMREMSPKEKQEAYNCDILYSTNNEIGFDYLRDNMVVQKNDRVQRALNFCIVDEVDSILIDEARTPLIISGGKQNSKNLYIDADKAVKALAEDEYLVDNKTKNVSITEKGAEHLEKIFRLENLYDFGNSALVHHVNNALKANYGFKKDVDYVVDNGSVIIVDPFTGRLMQGRQFSEGLHQAIEAKENVKINEETQTMATITFQNLFRMYSKLSGMTGTAKTEEEEFRNIYNMYVIRIPTNKPVVREDLADLVYSTEEGKYEAIVKTIKAVHATGQPILVGTISVENNERLSSMLKKEGLPHEVLNAKNHAREAEIIAHAGEKGAITIATNMAGRGTDIKLTDEVRELGGLCVIGTERHESRRIDNQLRGRAGRQGDPGMSQFFVSFEDDLMRRFGTDKVKNMVMALGLVGDQAIRSKSLTKSIESAQKKVEGNNFDMRKNLLDYDNVVNEQRRIIYEQRNNVIDNESIHDSIKETFRNTMEDLVTGHLAPEGMLTDKDLEEIVSYLNTNFLKTQRVTVEEIKDLDEGKMIEYLTNMINEDYELKIKDAPNFEEFERAISLRIIDSIWVEHLNAMEGLKEGIFLRQYAQTNPLQAYTMEGYEMFEQTLNKIDDTIAQFLLKANIEQNTQREQTIKGKTNEKEETTNRTVINKEKIGRNDLCPCGSGKKYKNCCGK